MSTLTISLTKEEVENILKQYAEDNIGRKAINVNIRIDMQHPDRIGESTYPLFIGADVVLGESNV